MPSSYSCSQENVVESATAIETSPERLEAIEVMLENLESSVEKVVNVVSSFEKHMPRIGSSSSNFLNAPILCTTVEEKKSFLRCYKELTLKYEQYVADHLKFNETYEAYSDWIHNSEAQFKKISSMPVINFEALIQKLKNVEELLLTKDEGLTLLSSTVQCGKKLKVGSSPEGWENVQVMLRNVQSSFHEVFDGASSLKRSLQSTEFSWSDFKDSFQRLQTWIASCSNHFYDYPPLVATLEEKKSLLHLYKEILVDIRGHEQAIDDLQYAANSLPKSDANIQEVISNLAERHKSLKSKSEEYISFYDDAVQDHRAYNKGVLELQKWLNSTQQSITLSMEKNLDRISLLGVKNILTITASFPLEKPKLSTVSESLEKVLKTTHTDSHESLTNDLKELQQQFESTESSAKSCSDYLEGLLKEWCDYEKRINEVQNSIQSICFKDQLLEKRAQLEKLKVIQEEIIEKGLEINALTDKSQQGPSKRNIKQLSELGIRYQLLVSKIKDTYAEWQYVVDHQDFENKVSKLDKMLAEIKKNIEFFESHDANLEDVQEKLSTVQLKETKEEAKHAGYENKELVEKLKKVTNENKTLEEKFSKLSAKVIELNKKLDNEEEVSKSLSQNLDDFEKKLIAAKFLAKQLVKEKHEIKDEIELEEAVKRYLLITGDELEKRRKGQIIGEAAGSSSETISKGRKKKKR